MFVSEDDGVHAVAYTLRREVADEARPAVLSDTDNFGDLAVAVPAGGERQDLAFPAGQGVQRGWRPVAGSVQVGGHLDRYQHAGELDAELGDVPRRRVSREPTAVLGVHLREIVRVRQQDADLDDIVQR